MTPSTLCISLVCVSIGAGAGGALRYWLSTVTASPLCTFIANMLGTTCIGLSWGLLTVHPNLWHGAFESLFIIGFAGGLSTWSTLAKELGEMLKAKDYLRYAHYLFWTLGVGTLFAWAGAQAGAWLASALL